MNFDDAMKAHEEWKNKLVEYISKPDRSLDTATVGADDECELGKWLRGEGQTHSGVAEFSQLKKDHRRFHKAAGAIVKKANAGNRVSEKAAMGPRSEYAAASVAVHNGLTAMKFKV
jgi:hypothetical protein